MDAHQGGSVRLIWRRRPGERPRYRLGNWFPGGLLVVENVLVAGVFGCDSRSQGSLGVRFLSKVNGGVRRLLRVPVTPRLFSI